MNVTCRTQSEVGNAPMTGTRTQLENLFGDWADIRDWIDIDMINWVCMLLQESNPTLTFSGIRGKLELMSSSYGYLIKYNCVP
jgi:hypothetical protein